LHIGTAPIGDKQVVRLEDLVTALIGYIEKALLTEKGDIIYASAVATPAALAHGNAGDVLTSGGHGVDPSWQASSAAWDGDIADIDLDGATDIGAALADEDLILVDDGAGGTNRKAALSRLKTYLGIGLALFTFIRTPIDLAMESTTISNMMTTTVGTPIDLSLDSTTISNMMTTAVSAVSI
jgi:hypothetical protein